jgi:hypothetical protein
MPIPLNYPTFDKLDHQFIVGYMPNPINLPVEGLNLLPCIWKKEWIGGFKSVDIAKDGDNVCYSDMFVSQIMFGIQTHYQEFPHLLKKLRILKFVINPSPLGILFINISLRLPLLLFFRHINNTYNILLI